MRTERVGPLANLVFWLAREFGQRTFVETGTYLSDDAWLATQYFYRVITLEGS